MDFLIFLLILKMSEIPCQAGPVFFYKKKVAYLFFLGPLFKSKIQPDESQNPGENQNAARNAWLKKVCGIFNAKAPANAWGKCLAESRCESACKNDQHFRLQCWLTIVPVIVWCFLRRAAGLLCSRSVAFFMPAHQQHVTAGVFSRQRPLIPPAHPPPRIFVFWGGQGGGGYLGVLPDSNQTNTARRIRRPPCGCDDCLGTFDDPVVVVRVADQFDPPLHVLHGGEDAVMAVGEVVPVGCSV
jgi:hypothetical protein